MISMANILIAINYAYLLLLLNELLILSLRRETDWAKIDTIILFAQKKVILFSPLQRFIALSFINLVVRNTRASFLANSFSGRVDKGLKRFMEDRSDLTCCCCL